MPRYAAIDLGTNTLLMLVAEFGSDGTFEVITDRELTSLVLEAPEGPKSVLVLDRAMADGHEVAARCAWDVPAVVVPTIGW